MYGLAKTRCRRKTSIQEISHTLFTTLRLQYKYKQRHISLCVRQLTKYHQALLLIDRLTLACINHPFHRFVSIVGSHRNILDC